MDFRKWSLSELISCDQNGHFETRCDNGCQNLQYICMDHRKIIKRSNDISKIAHPFLQKNKTI